MTQAPIPSVQPVEEGLSDLVTCLEGAGHHVRGPLLLFVSEVTDPKATRRSLATIYALMIAGYVGAGSSFWTPINKALNARLSLNTPQEIDSFRKVGWAIHDRAAKLLHPSTERSDG